MIRPVALLLDRQGAPIEWLRLVQTVDATQQAAETSEADGYVRVVGIEQSFPQAHSLGPCRVSGRKIAGNCRRWSEAARRLPRRYQTDRVLKILDCGRGAQLRDVQQPEFGPRLRCGKVAFVGDVLCAYGGDKTGIEGILQQWFGTGVVASRNGSGRLLLDRRDLRIVVRRCFRLLEQSEMPRRNLPQL